MKNLFFGCALAFAVLATSSCKNDNSGCETCSGDLIGIPTTVEVCQDGDNVVTTTTALGVSQTDTQVGTVAQVTAGLEAGGLNCD